MKLVYFLKACILNLGRLHIFMNFLLSAIKKQVKKLFLPNLSTSVDKK